MRFEEDEWVLQILISHKAIVPGSNGKKQKNSCFYVGKSKALKNSLFALSAAANIEPKQTCNNLGWRCIRVCVRWGESVGIKVIMLLINVALWLTSQQRSGSGFLLLRWTRQNSLRLLKSCSGINSLSWTTCALLNMHGSIRYDSQQGHQGSRSESSWQANDSFSIFQLQFQTCCCFWSLPHKSGT